MQGFIAGWRSNALALQPAALLSSPEHHALLQWWWGLCCSAALAECSHQNALPCCSADGEYAATVSTACHQLLPHIVPELPRVWAVHLVVRNDLQGRVQQAASGIASFFLNAMVTCRLEIHSWTAYISVCSDLQVREAYLGSARQLQSEDAALRVRPSTSLEQGHWCQELSSFLRGLSQ